ncbi:Lysine-specific permease [compost metagenome]
MYASSRVLYSLAKRGKAPKALAKLNSRGVPINALLLTTLVGMTAFFASLFGDGVVYTWLLNASGMCGFITWLGIAISHYRFRRAFKAQGRDVNELPYKARWFPFGPIFAFVLCMIVILGQNTAVFTGEKVDWYGFAVTYLSIPLFLVLWLGYKWTKRTKVIPLKECDLSPTISSND